MRHILLLLSVSISVDAVISKIFCDACFDGVCYIKSLIYKKHPVSGQLAIDRNENIVYFHYQSWKSSDHTVAYDLDDIRLFTVPNIQFSFAKTVDQNSGDVYLGGANGVYKYEAKSSQTSLYGLSDKTIWHMQYKKMLYYTNFMSKGLFTYDKKQSRSIKAFEDFIIDDFVIDKNDDIYFVSNFTVYKLERGDKKALVFSNITYSLSTDSNDNVYFVQKDSKGLFTVDYKDGKLIEVGAFGDGSPYRMVFDKFNNIIYYNSDDSKLYCLLPNYAMCKVKGKGVGRKQRKKVSRLNTK